MLPEMELFEMNAWDHVVAAVICIFAPVLAYVSRRMKTEDLQLEPEDKIRLYHSNALLLVVFALVTVTVWRMPGRSLEALGFTWPHWSPVVISLLIIVFLFYGLDLFFQYGLKKWRERTWERRQGTLSLIPSDGRELFHFSLLALAAGIGEEIIFRGFLIHYLMTWTGSTAMGIAMAGLISSILFGFLHGYQGFASMIKVFFIALLFAGIFIFSQSLIIVMLAHLIIDLLSGWLGIHIHRDYQQEEDTRQGE
jgi:membrane protease YdiL (CAAX protease family)